MSGCLITLSMSNAILHRVDETRHEPRHQFYVTRSQPIVGLGRLDGLKPIQVAPLIAYMITYICMQILSLKKYVFQEFESLRYQPRWVKIIMHKSKQSTYISWPH